MKFVVCYALLALTACSQQETMVPPPANPAPILQGSVDDTNWVVDTSKSTVSFTTSQSGESFTGLFETFSAQIRFDTEDLTSSKVITLIDMFSADAGEIERTGALTEKDWFYAERFPKAKFETTGFTHLGGKHYEAAANLTLRGINNAVTLPFTLEFSGNQVHMNGAVTLNRADYHVGSGMWAATDSIPNDVGVTIDLYAVKTQ